MRVNHKETGTSDGGKPPRNAEPIRLLLCRKADSGARESPAVRSAGGATLLACRLASVWGIGSEPSMKRRAASWFLC
jgi:hypothetical protein